jgi:hypothetical protein
MKRTILVFLGLITVGSGFAQAKKKSPLDGRIYTITLTPEGEKKPESIKDEASFAVGKFKSNFLLQAGFTQSDYEYEVDSTTQIIKFSVEAKNELMERFSWEGSMDGDNITGTAVIRKKGKIQRSFAISGSQKNKKKAKPQPKAAAALPVKSDSTTKSE